MIRLSEVYCNQIIRLFGSTKKKESQVIRLSGVYCITLQCLKKHSFWHNQQQKKTFLSVCSVVRRVCLIDNDGRLNGSAAILMQRHHSDVVDYHIYQRKNDFLAFYFSVCDGASVEMDQGSWWIDDRRKLLSAVKSFSRPNRNTFPSMQ